MVNFYETKFTFSASYELHFFFSVSSDILREKKTDLISRKEIPVFKHAVNTRHS